MGSQLGFRRGGQKPNDILWLDPIDIQLGRLVELTLAQDSRAIALGSMSYTYLKITLSLRKAGFDAVLLDYDWRRDVATLGKLLAERIAADGKRKVALVGHSMGGLVARAALTHAAGDQVSQLLMLGTPNAGSLGAIQALRGTYSVVRKIAMLDLRHDAEFLASEVFATFPGLHELLSALAPNSTSSTSIPGRQRVHVQRPRCCGEPPDSRSAWRPRMLASTPSSAATASPPPAWRCATAISNTNTACAAMAPCPSSSRSSKARAIAMWIAVTAICRCPIA